MVIQGAEESRDASMAVKLSAAGEVGHIVNCLGVLSNCFGPLFPVVIFSFAGHGNLYMPSQR